MSSKKKPNKTTSTKKLSEMRPHEAYVLGHVDAIEEVIAWLQTHLKSLDEMSRGK